MKTIVALIITLNSFFSIAFSQEPSEQASTPPINFTSVSDALNAIEQQVHDTIPTELKNDAALTPQAAYLKYIQQFSTAKGTETGSQILFNLDKTIKKSKSKKIFSQKLLYQLAKANETVGNGGQKRKERPTKPGVRRELFPSN